MAVKCVAACVLLLALSACANAAETNGVPRRSLKGLILGHPLVGKALPTVSLSVSKGAAAPAPSATAPAPAPSTPRAPTTTQPAKQQPQPQQPQQQQQPAAAPAPAPRASAPSSLPPPQPVAGSSNFQTALSCQSAFNAAGGRSGVEAQIGNVCREGDAAFNALACCQKTASVLNSGSFRGCACDNLVYQQLCQEVKIQNLNCDNLRGQLIACGLQC